MDTKLNGVKKLKPEVLWYAAVSSVATFLPETFMAQVAVDERVCRILSDLKDGCNDESLFVGEIKPHVWMRLAYTATSEMQHEDRLRDDCMLATQVAYAFLDYRVFSTARSMPWSLTQGDIVKNLQELYESKDPMGDPIAAKILRLKEQGHSVLQGRCMPFKII